MLELAFNINELNTLSYEELLLIEGGNWVRTTVGVVTGVSGAIGGTVVGASAGGAVGNVPGAVIGGAGGFVSGGVAGYNAGVGVYDYFAN